MFLNIANKLVVKKINQNAYQVGQAMFKHIKPKFWEYIYKI